MAIFGKSAKRTAEGSTATVAVPAVASADEADLSTVLAIVRRQWPVILLSLALFGGAALVYSTLAPKVWRSSARVLLDPRDKQLVGNDVSRQAAGGVEAGWVDTQLELVKSFDTLADAVKRENLLADPEFVGALDKSDPSALGIAVRNLAESVVVERPKENNLIDVTVGSRSPEKAARLANAVAGAFVDTLAKAKVDQIEQANRLLARQIDDVRAKMQESEARVEEYKRNNGIATTRGNLVEEETLRQSSEALVAARTRAQEARERSERLAQLLKSGDTVLLSQSDAIGSAVISRLKIEEAAAQRRQAELEQTLGPHHPRVTGAAAEVARARAQVAAEVKSLAATAALDDQVAHANEEAARKAVERAQAHLADASQAVVGLQEIENEANARRELYKSLVGRMEETTLQRNTQISDARIVSPAQIPLKPFSPRASLALALALVAGLGFGLALALHRGRPRPSAARSNGIVVETADTAHIAARKPASVASVAVADTSVETPPAAVGEPMPPKAAPAPAAPIAANPVPAPDVVAASASASASATATATATAERSTVSLASLDESRAARRRKGAASATPASNTDTPRRDRLATFVVSLDAIARMGTADLAGGGAAALVETDEGHVDPAGASRLDELAAALELADGHGPCVIFSETVPTIVTAALAFGLARAAGLHGATTALVDVAHEDDAFDAFFAHGHTAAAARLPGEGSWERVYDSGLVMARPTEPIVVGMPASRPADLPAFLASLGGHVRHTILHLGWRPDPDFLDEIAGFTDRLIAVVDEVDFLRSEEDGDEPVDPVSLPELDGVVVITRDPAEDHILRRAARRRRSTERGAAFQR